MSNRRTRRSKRQAPPLPRPMTAEERLRAQAELEPEDEELEPEEEAESAPLPQVRSAPAWQTIGQAISNLPGSLHAGMVQVAQIAEVARASRCDPKMVVHLESIAELMNQAILESGAAIGYVMDEVAADLGFSE